ncbi:hypothetical protein [Enterococcus mundtii]|uniref:hypothetical protein n=1 Tax=Enterococcus mundtii TaxID=53346 RepID=UPI0035C69C6B
MDNRKENIMSVEKMKQRSRKLSKHLPKSPATEIKQLTKSLMNTVARIQELKEKREQLSDHSTSSKKYRELTAGIKNNEKRAQELLDKIDKLSPKQVDKLVERYTDSAEPIYETIPSDTKRNEKDAPLPEIRDRTKKEVVNAVTEANRKFNETHKDISKEPYANRQPKIKFDAKTLINGMDKKRSQKFHKENRSHRSKEKYGKAEPPKNAITQTKKLGRLIIRCRPNHYKKRFHLRLRNLH